VARMGEKKLYKVFVEKFEGKRLLGRPGRCANDSIKIYLKFAGRPLIRLMWLTARTGGCFS
jgi:hypothetical protein